MAILLAGLFEDMMWRDKAMGHEPPEPVRDMIDVVVAFFFVHGNHDLPYFGIYGGVVALPPVQERVVVK